MFDSLQTISRTQIKSRLVPEDKSEQPLSQEAKATKELLKLKDETITTLKNETDKLKQKNVQLNTELAHRSAEPTSQGSNVNKDKEIESLKKQNTALNTQINLLLNTTTPLPNAKRLREEPSHPLIGQPDKESQPENETYQPVKVSYNLAHAENMASLEAMMNKLFVMKWVSSTTDSTRFNIHRTIPISIQEGVLQRELTIILMHETKANYVNLQRAIKA